MLKITLLSMYVHTICFPYSRQDNSFNPLKPVGVFPCYTKQKITQERRQKKDDLSQK